MARYDVLEAKEVLPELIRRALDGETVVIADGGQSGVSLKPVQESSRPIAEQWTQKQRNAFYRDLARRREALPTTRLSAAELVRSMRDEDLET